MLGIECQSAISWKPPRKISWEQLGQQKQKLCGQTSQQLSAFLVILVEFDKYWQIWDEQACLVSSRSYLAKQTKCWVSKQIPSWLKWYESQQKSNQAGAEGWLMPVKQSAEYQNWFHVVGIGSRREQMSDSYRREPKHRQTKSELTQNVSGQHASKITPRWRLDVMPNFVKTYQ